MASEAVGKTVASDGADAGAEGASDEPELIDASRTLHAEESTPSSSRFGALLGSASSLKKKASPFLSKAKQAIVEEAKQFKDDVKDVAGGVREGMELTKQDLKEHTKGWRSAFGAKLRSFGKAEEELPAAAPAAASPAPAAASSAQDEALAKVGAEATAPAASSGKLQALRQNLANTAKDVNELRQEFVDEVRLSVNDIRQVLSRAPAAESEEPEAAEATEAATPKAEKAEDSGFNKVKASVFRKAGDLRENWRHRFEDYGATQEAFWLLPSSQANYVQLNLPFKDSNEDRVARVKKLGGKLKGSLAKKGKEVSDGVAHLAQDLRERRRAAAKRGGLAADAAAGGAGLGERQTSEDVNLGDSIFAIGSDEEDWSDGWEGTSDGGQSETPSTRSASRVEGEAEAK